MHKFLLPLILVASLGTSSLAFAATTATTAAKPATAMSTMAPKPTWTTTDGTIKAIDAKACTITLDNKAVYHFVAKCDFSKLTAGEKVAVTWQTKHKLHWANKVVAVKA
jgi:Cu/Ag efflux protein CusF